MHKIWLVIKYEYHRHVMTKRFLFSLLTLPVGLIVMMGIGALVAWFSIDTTPVGYIDHAEILITTTLPERTGSLFDPVITMVGYPDQEQARIALEAEEIQAYYVIPEDYPANNEITLVYFDALGTEYQQQFITLLRRNLVVQNGLDPVIQSRLSEGSQITVSSLDESREMRQDQWLIAVMPFVAGIIFLIVIMTSGGYLLQAVVEEKENRTMEIVITSIPPGQLMAGKIVGNIAVGLTQLFIWLIFAWIAVGVGGQFWPALAEFSIPGDFMLVLMLVLLPSFVMVAAIMASIGATMTETQEAQQVSGLFALPITIPFYLTTFIIMNPNGLLAVSLSYFPLTAPITILMRMAFTIIPVWQLAINILILVLFSILAVWFAGRAFRLGMLQYGKKLPLKAIFRRRVTQ